jgi:hypothetical protein
MRQLARSTIINRVAALVVAGLSLFCPQFGFAQYDPTNVDPGAQKAMFEEIMRGAAASIADVLNDSDKYIIDSIAFSYDGESLDWAKSFVDDSGRRYIVLSGAFFYYSDVANNAYLTCAILNCESTDILLHYVDDMSAWIEKNRDLQELNEPPEAFSDICEFASLDCSQIAFDDNYANALNRIRKTTLTIVLGHEIAHHLNSDFDAGTETDILQSEVSADRFGIEVAVLNGLNPLLATGTYLLWGAGIGDETFSSEETEHPKPLCQMLRLWLMSYDVLKSDASLRAEPAHSDLSQAFEAMGDSLAGARQEAAACGL